VTTHRIEKLTKLHAIDRFDCGQEALNRYLLQFALPNQQANAAQTYAGLIDMVVVGYYTLAVGAVGYEDAPERLKNGLARHPVPIMLLARLAVSTTWQGKGLGARLLRDAVRRTLQAADIAGIRAIIVHAKDEEAAGFYQHFDFAPAPTDSCHLFALIEDLRREAGDE
jgi:GNAT superfamily N-acetyltransferase